MNKKQKRGHNKNIQLIKELDREILILPFFIPCLLRSAADKVLYFLAKTRIIDTNIVHQGK